MDKLGNLFGEILAKKNLAKITKGALILSIIKTFFKENNIDCNFGGKLNNNIFIIKISNSVYSHMIFLNKGKLLKNINNQLNNMGYTNITDIKIL